MAKAGFMLVAVMVVIMLASMVAVSLLFRLRAEETATVASEGVEQAWATAMSGVNEAMRIIAANQMEAIPGKETPSLFRNRFVFDDGSDQWYYTIFSIGEPDSVEINNGLSDEAGKLNVNMANEEMLAKLPGMSPSLAQAILDFIDPDDIPRPEGAEQEYYDTLQNPYRINNGYLSSLEELLMVRGVTGSVFYGEDANINFLLDPNENDGEERFPTDDNDGVLNNGLRRFLTIYSYELNVDKDGLPRPNINKPETIIETNDFPASLLAYLSAAIKEKKAITNIAELLEARISTKDSQGKSVEVESGVDKESLALVWDRLSTTDDEKLYGLINVNTAPAAVLKTLPMVDEALAESIESARNNLNPDQKSTPAWLYQEGVVNADTFKAIAPYITARSKQHSFHVVGYGTPSGRYRVLEVVVDSASGTPSICYMRDITRLKLPFKIEVAKEL